MPDTLPRGLHRDLLMTRLRAALEHFELIGIGDYLDGLETLDAREVAAAKLEGIGA